MSDALTPGQYLGKQVRFWREQRKISAQALATRCAELGATALTRAAISKIEVGQRSVSVNEWLQLAHALAVPPPLLFLDLKNGQPVKIAERSVLAPWLAWQWVIGDEPPILTERTVTRAEEWMQARTAINLYASQQDASRAVDDANSNIRAAGYAGDDAGLKAGRAELVTALRAVAECLDEMVRIGMTPPEKPAQWVETIRELGLSKYPDSLRVFDPEASHGER